MLLNSLSPSMCDGIDLETLLEPVETDDEDDWHRYYPKVSIFSDNINFAVIYLKFKHRSQTIGYFVKKTQTVKTLEQSDLGLHCLHRPICPKN